MLLRQTWSFFTRITNIDFKIESRTVPLSCTLIKLTNIMVNCPLKLAAPMRQFSWYFHCNRLWFKTKSSVNIPSRSSCLVAQRWASITQAKEQGDVYNWPGLTMGGWTTYSCYSCRGSQEHTAEKGIKR